MIFEQKRKENPDDDYFVYQQNKTNFGHTHYGNNIVFDLKHEHTGHTHLFKKSINSISNSI